MSFSSGTYTHDAADFPAESETLIESNKYNNILNAIATGLTLCLLKDGSQTVTSDIPFGDNKLTGVKDATLTADAANLKVIQNGIGVYSGTVGGTADVITLTPAPSIAGYVAGQTFRFISSGANTTTVTVNVSGTGAKAITKNGTTALVSGDIPNASMVTITYDGTQFILGNLGASTNAAVMTTQGDMVRGGASGAAERFPIGATDMIVYSDATDPLWGYPGDVPQNSNPGTPLNFGMSVVLSTNDIVVTLTTADGSTPSTTKPVWIPFRSSTATSGVVSWTKMTATEVLTLPAGGTLGHTAADITAGTTKIRAYIYAMRNGANDVELIITRQALRSGDTLQSTTAIGTGSDSNIVLYSTTSRTTKPIKLVGVIEISATTTPGTWTSVDNVVNWTPGMRKTGDVIQTQYVENSTAFSTAAVIPLDSTIPQVGEGAVAPTLTTLTPTSAINFWEIHGNFATGANTAVSTAITLFTDTVTNDAVGAWAHDVEGSGRFQVVSVDYRQITGSTALFSFRFGPLSSATMYLNRNGTGDNLLGGLIQTTILLREIYA